MDMMCDPASDMAGCRKFGHAWCMVLIVSRSCTHRPHGVPLAVRILCLYREPRCGEGCLQRLQSSSRGGVRRVDPGVQCILRGEGGRIVAQSQEDRTVRK